MGLLKKPYSRVHERSLYKQGKMMVWDGINAGEVTDMHVIRNDTLAAQNVYSRETQS